MFEVIRHQAGVETGEANPQPNRPFAGFFSREIQLEAAQALRAELEAGMKSLDVQIKALRSRAGKG